MNLAIFLSLRKISMYSETSILGIVLLFVRLNLCRDEMHHGHGTVLGTLGDWVKISPKEQFNSTPTQCNA